MDFQGALAVCCANFLLCALDLEFEQFVGIDFIVDHDLSRDSVTTRRDFKLHNCNRPFWFSPPGRYDHHFTGV